MLKTFLNPHFIFDYILSEDSSIMRLAYNLFRSFRTTLDLGSKKNVILGKSKNQISTFFNFLDFHTFSHFPFLFLFFMRFCINDFFFYHSSNSSNFSNMTFLINESLPKVFSTGMKGGKTFGRLQFLLEVCFSKELSFLSKKELFQLF